MSLDLSKVPKERWAGALAMALLKYFEGFPPALFALVEAGEEKFVKDGKKTDAYNLSEHHYRKCFKILRRKARDMGFDPRRH